MEQIRIPYGNDLQLQVDVFRIDSEDIVEQIIPSSIDGLAIRAIKALDYKAYDLPVHVDGGIFADLAGLPCGVYDLELTGKVEGCEIRSCEARSLALVYDNEDAYGFDIPQLRIAEGNDFTLNIHMSTLDGTAIDASEFSAISVMLTSPATCRYHKLTPVIDSALLCEVHSLPCGVYDLEVLAISGRRQIRSCQRCAIAVLYNSELATSLPAYHINMPVAPAAVNASYTLDPKQQTVAMKFAAVGGTSKSPFIPGKGANSAVIDSDTYCEATGVSSFAMGIHAKAIGEASVAMGRFTKAEGRAAVAMGGAINSIYITGEANATEYIATNIIGSYREDPALLIGYDILEYRTDGKQSHLATITNAEPTGTLGTVRITVDKSLSEGPISNMRYYLHYCRAAANNSTVLGAGGAHVKFSSAIGFCVADKDYAVAIGLGTIAAGYRSFSSGYLTKSVGANSHTEGHRTRAIGIDAHAEGSSTRAVGNESHAEGFSAYNIYLTGGGLNSTYHIQHGSNWQCIEDLEKLIGGEIIEYNAWSTVATIQSYSLADDGFTLAVTLDKSLGVLDKAKFGILLNIASGDFSHTQNSGTKASGKNATSMGTHTVASGNTSLATGDRTFATGTNSSTHGENTHALNKNEAAFGVANISHDGEGLDAQTLFSIGCGDDLPGMNMADRIRQRIPLPKMEDGRNAFEVMRNGDIWYGGYRTGVKVWDALSRMSPYLVAPNGTSQQVILGNGSLKSLDDISPVTEEDAQAIHSGIVHDISGIERTGTHLNIELYKSYRKGDGWEGEYVSLLMPLATSTLAGIMSAVDKAKLDAINTSAGSSMSIAGTVNLTNGAFVTLGNSALDSYAAVFSDMNVGEMRMYLVSDSNGKLPSTSETAITVPYDGIMSPAFLYFGKNAPFGVSVGDICVLLKRSTLLNVCRIIPLNDVKPSNGDFPGADGLSTVWDKTRINKIDDIEWTANYVRDNYLPKSDRFPSRSGWLVNVDECLEAGVYPTCAQQFQGWASDYFTCVVQKTSTIDSGGYHTVEQTAYGRGSDAGEIKKRIIFHKPDGSDTRYSPWTQINRVIYKAEPYIPDTLNPNITYIDTLSEDEHLSITGLVPPTDIVGEYTVNFRTSTGNIISLPDYLLWANGEQPVFEDNTFYELSISAASHDGGYVYKAVLVAFK